MIVPIPLGTLTDLYDLARRRDQHKAERFNKHNPMRRQLDADGRPPSWFAHLTGLLGEHAAGRVYGNVDVDRRIWRDHGDAGSDTPGHDLSLVLGHIGIQVKTRTRFGWDFALTGSDPAEFQADLGVLCYPGDAHVGTALRNGDLDALLALAHADVLSVLVYGHITRRQFQRSATLREYRAGYGARLVVPMARFTPALGYYTMSQVVGFAAAR